MQTLSKDQVALRLQAPNGSAALMGQAEAALEGALALFLEDQDPAACGFDAPLAVVQVTTADGTKTLTYASGTDGDYLMVEGDDSIYAVDGSIVQAVTQTADALTAA